MSKQFSESERILLSFATSGNTFQYKGSKCIIIRSGKPTCPKGEPKTDLYVEYKEVKSSLINEIKISYKQVNADFLENKISKTRAEQILGKDWSQKINRSLDTIKDNFHARKLIFKSKSGNTQKGSFTLGWKFELLNKPGGELSGEILLSLGEIIDIYSGTNLEESKKNAQVNYEIIPNSGIATHILSIDQEKIKSLQGIIENIISIDEYIISTKYTKIYFACKALNYRSFENKFDGDRPLAVIVDWSIKRKKLNPSLNFSQPLQFGGNNAHNTLMNALTELNISNTDDVNENNLQNYKKNVFE
jgi:hypothetical protein